MPNKTHITIVGVGPRGLNLLERLSAILPTQGNDTALHLHLVEPGVLGCGVHPMDQPPSLLVNTVASQITMYTDESVKNAGPSLQGPSLYEWACTEGYRYDEASRKYSKTTGRVIQENDYLPRAVFGTYLKDTAISLLNTLEKHCNISYHRQTAVDIEKINESGFRVTLSDQSIIFSNYIFLTTGHPQNALTDSEKTTLANIARLKPHYPRLSLITEPYPILDITKSIDEQMTVAIEGFGLTSTDIISELTIGKGGQFLKVSHNRLQYQPSGREPKKIVLYSKTGLPFTGRATNQKGVSGQYKPVFFTVDAIHDLRQKHGIGAKKQLDFEKHVLPLIQLEMRFCYIKTLITNQSQDTAHIDHFLKKWKKSIHNAKELECLELDEFGETALFNWQDIFDPTYNQTFETEEDYRGWLIRYIKQDIENSIQGNVNNPFKAACDVLRDTRDNIRLIIDHSGLTPQAHRQFMEKYMPVMNRISVGPPKERIIELLALVEIGLVDIFVGRSPRQYLDENRGQFIIDNPQNIKHHSPRAVDQVIKARIASTDPTVSLSPLMKSMLNNGLVRPFKNGDFSPGGIDIDRDFHPINTLNQCEKNIYALGTIVEGPKFYTYIVPRSGVNSTALVDAGKLIFDLLASINTKEQKNRFYFFQQRDIIGLFGLSLIVLYLAVLCYGKNDQTGENISPFNPSHPS